MKNVKEWDTSTTEAPLIQKSINKKETKYNKLEDLETNKQNSTKDIKSPDIETRF